MSTSDNYESALQVSTVAGPASKEMIASAEQQLSLTFPDEYRSFLEQYGAAMGIGFEIAGLFHSIGNGPPLWRNITTESLRFRKSVRGMLPEALLPISSDGGGLTYYLDANSDEHGTNPVVAYGPGVDGVRVANTFKEFVVIAANEKLGGA